LGVSVLELFSNHAGAFGCSRRSAWPVNVLSSTAAIRLAPLDPTRQSLPKVGRHIGAAHCLQKRAQRLKRGLEGPIFVRPTH
jgi:hypothetical protein